MDRKNLLIWIILCFTCPAFAQTTWENREPDKEYKDALLLFDMQNYQGARKMLEHYVSIMEPMEFEQDAFYISNAQYYIAVSALELYQPDAEKLLLDFTENSHETPLKRKAYYHLGRYYFRDRKYKDAISWFNLVEPSELSREERNEYNFQKAYCHFFNKEFKEALPLFKQTKDISNKYYYPSNYYYGYISFINGDYDQALASFEKIKESQQYQKIIPYYISQIYFKKKQYNEAVSYLSPIVEDNKQVYYAELNLTMGQSQFELGKYEEALPYLEVYAKGKNLTKEESYQLSYAYYKAQNYTKAIERLRPLDNQSDSLGQNALFLLGESYLQTKNKTNARAAFQKASKMKWDAYIAESATFQYGKLSYDAGMDNEAINTLQAFVKTYPNSKNTQEAKELLTDLFLSSNDYQQALEIIESMPDKSPKVKKAYQSVAFNRGIKLFNEGNYNEALKLFEVSLTNPIDQEIKALCYYWKGEAYYQLGEYQKATWQYPQFFTLASSNNLKDEEWLSITANYSNAYSYLKQERYTDAATYFEKTVNAASKSSNTEVKSNIVPDAYLRMGDSYFMLKSYEKSLNAYNQAIDRNTKAKEYAMYQKGMLLGLQGNYSQQVTSFQQLVQSFPKGFYTDDALYQMGSAYELLENNTQAISTYNRITKEFVTSPFFTKAYLKLAAIYYNQSNWDKANESYNKVIDALPNSQDALLAYGRKRDLAVASGNSKYASDRKGSNYTISADDSLQYEIALKQFRDENYTQSAKYFNDYIADFPKGFFALQAHFYKAESNYYSKNYGASLPDYEYVLDKAPNEYLEESASKASELAYNDKDYAKAAEYYDMLLKNASNNANIYRANVGLMRSYYRNGKLADAVPYANWVIASPDATAAHLHEANYYVGKAAFAANDYAKSTPYLKKVADGPSNSLTAEARYLLALIEHKKNNYEQSNTLAYKLINDMPNFDEWIVRSYILLADNYTGLGNLFQAKATLQSILDNYEGDDAGIVQEVKQKLAAVEAREAKENSYKIEQDTSGTLQEDPNMQIEINSPEK
ncbi:MAG: tetratricopeptide repeat protein [Chitinophagales bacterium]|nr:tetratricopeptide repeat protein [Chitinophagales bacterium]